MDLLETFDICIDRVTVAGIEVGGTVALAAMWGTIIKSFVAYNTVRGDFVKETGQYQRIGLKTFFQNFDREVGVQFVD